MRGLILSFGQTIGKFVCNKNAIEDFWYVHIFCITIERRVVDSNMHGFCRHPGNLIVFLVYNLKLEDVGSRVVVGNTVHVNCTDNMTSVFFFSIFQTSAEFSCERKDTIFIWAVPFADCVLC